ncbi:hypothetical protein LUZ61_020661 [Rhynchospora tenuis]|uniref:Diphthine--ammonia ligase n=1 Tax=Rhynchospora tenuis TaxID=198213 RepID=A0AAD5ZDQ8_9POAL|nr:hypothetical protein LUZ61_020661 [Rhynchospora tenuis]
MKVVALVSGGKDSCFAMMRCIDYGHEIVALANLIPLDDSVDELDSYMYQTAGHQIIVSYAECMGLPLFRRRIHGSTREHSVNYRMTPGDEVEDMYALLHEVKRQIPSVNAVSSGAIASDYQRMRVESVCSRLGLVSLAFLWKQDQITLLEEMIRRGIVAVTVKVAAIGLNPSEHLGRELKDLKLHLLKLNEKYGIHVCGEGGEYETLTLDCPLFHNARIVIDKYKGILDNPNSTIASVGVLHPLSFHLEQKNASYSTSDLPAVFEVEGNPTLTQTSSSKPLDSEFDPNKGEQAVNFRFSSTGKNLLSIGCWIQNSSKTSKGLQEDLAAVLRQIELRLGAEGFGWVNVLYIHLYISDMKKFALANEVYVKYITSAECHFGVPSRSTIELPLVKCGLGGGYVEVLVAREPEKKKVLHVQSISCWAPSCIGPYSQATQYKGVLYMAGQLGLDPPTMNLCVGGPTAELEQALQNSEAVAKCFNTSIFTSTFLFVIYCSARLNSSEKIQVQEKLKSSFDSSDNPTFLYVLASDLPKGASVEVKPVIYASEVEEETEELEVGTLRTPLENIFGKLQIDKTCYQLCNIKGKLLSCIVSITSAEASKICSQQDDNVFDFQCGSKMHMKTIATFCVSFVAKILCENGFSWDDLLILRFYYPTRISLSADLMDCVFSEAFLHLAQVDESIKFGKEPLFNLVPVIGSGQSAHMDDFITCELLASKL